MNRADPFFVSVVWACAGLLTIATTGTMADAATKPVKPARSSGTADPAGGTYLGGWVLAGEHAWALGEAGAADGDVGAQGRARDLAARVCAATGARVGLSVVNTGPDETAMVVLYDGEAHGRAIRFRGHEPHAHTWTASLALDMVRRLCLGLPAVP